MSEYILSADEQRFIKRCYHCRDFKNSRTLYTDTYELKYCKRHHAMTPALKRPGPYATACAPCYYEEDQVRVEIPHESTTIT